MPQSDLTLRTATLADCRLIHDLAWQVFPATYRDILTPGQIDYMMEWMYSEPNIARQMTDEGHVYMLAVRGGEPVGYVSVQPEGRDWHLQKIYVLPTAQGTHCGSFLFGAATDYIRRAAQGPCTMRLNVNRYNRALDFYLHMGMHIESEGDFDIGGGYFMNDYILAMQL